MMCAEQITQAFWRGKRAVQFFLRQNWAPVGVKIIDINYVLWMYTILSQAYPYLLMPVYPMSHYSVVMCTINYDL